MNTNTHLRADPITESVDELASYICHKEKHNFRSDEEDSDDEIRPFKGFAKPLSNYKPTKNKDIWTEKSNRLLQLVGEHVDEALQTGFDDSIAKYKGKGHFVVKLKIILFVANEFNSVWVWFQIPSGKLWFEMFKLLHKIFVENPDNANFEPNDSDYVSCLNASN